MLNRNKNKIVYLYEIAMSSKRILGQSQPFGGPICSFSVKKYGSRSSTKVVKAMNGQESFKYVSFVHSYKVQFILC